MPEITVTAIKGVARIHQREYPMYSAFLTPAQLLEFSDVPSFNRDEPHISISTAIENDDQDASWQRPLDTERIERIQNNIDRAIRRDSSNDCLMANPVLVGRSDMAGTQDTEVSATPLIVNGMTVPTVFTLSIKKLNANQDPLWILDGQHRIHGMGNSPLGAMQPNGSILADEVIPVVFIIDEQYEASFLAKIFTEVTTEAVKMDELHGDWMQYTFGMNEYREQAAKLSMEVVIKLNNNDTFGATQNPFYRSIQYNPNLDVLPVLSFGKLKANEFRKFFQKRYYSNRGNGTPVEVATAVVRFLEASADLDAHFNGDSRLLGTIQPHSSLAYEYIGKFLSFLSQNTALIDNSIEQWKDFLRHADRLFQNSNWSLPLIGNSSTTGDAYNPSKHASERTFQHFFNSPSELGGVPPSEYLTGPGPFYFEHGVKTATDTFNPHNAQREEAFANNGQARQNIRGQGSDIIRIKPNPDHQISIIQVHYMDGPNWVRLANHGSGIVLPNPGTAQVLRIRVHTMGYGRDSEKQDIIDILYD
jgi:hypothetical protein